ncbi:glycosyltransferase family 4 protein [Chryseobacterium balustinum]|uniref:Glycogen synthase n=1 Tax=Chryseobacterium balustinum TaxID=246 RepID=A0AAX2IRE2_9FLAO|nr:glycosyltransferase family 4 protein [Chryseobacterium balustinum]AZB28243.1 glycosyltransferase [Chryseobacterium balustinum]SKB90346.1 Glycosyltransferase involved in cell wall bisynthesis [Chryseobacterium balustinum]SQA92325.1 Glycogen synthase [Chryseobacterium balustinum]
MESKKKGTILLHAWTLQRLGNEHYIPNTHWIYLNEIINYYDNIILLSPVKVLDYSDKIDGHAISHLKNVSVYPLPFTSGGYISSLKYFFSYLKAYRNLKNIDTYYARYPVPFGWLQKVYGKSSKRIIHYVGDPIDAAEKNPNFSWIKKTILINGFKLENSFYTWACKEAKVFTNGHHIAEKLAKKNIQATALVSSTLTDNDFYFKEKNINPTEARFIYLGYLRTAKGVETIIKAFGMVQRKIPNIKLTVIGGGEFDTKLKSICNENNFRNIDFLGHIDDRLVINNLFREGDIFLFGSLSEGSPRVILEAMANGLLIISTPVGSLPKTFVDNEEIIFANFNDVEDFKNKIISIIYDNDKYNFVRKKGFEKIKDFTIKNFIKSIFYEA